MDLNHLQNELTTTFSVLSKTWQLKLKILMLKVLQLLPLVLNLIMSTLYLLLIIPGNPFLLRISSLQLVLLMLFCPVLWIISKALNYCICHRLYIYLLLLFSITISIWFCDVVFIIHGALLLLLISLCIYFNKGLC